MCTIISTELVIGNLLLEAVSCDLQAISLDQVFEFESRLNEELLHNHLAYYSDLDYEEISFSLENFDDIFVLSENDISFEINTKDKQSIINLLFNFFRKGLPDFLRNIFSNVFLALEA